MKELTLITFLFFTATGSSSDYVYEEYNNGGTVKFRHIEEPDYYSDLMEKPKFLSTPQIFKVEESNGITFPCAAENNNHHLLMMFKHISDQSGRERTIYLDDTKVNPHSRIRKEGSSFVLEEVHVKDSGQYICIFETEPHAVELRHTLDVQYPAQINRISPDFQSINQGSTIKLECTADGNPTPAITWSKESGILPSGLKTEEGVSISLENINRHVEGDYICTASNGIGVTSSAHMKIEVEYPPEIKSQQEMINTARDSEGVLTCIVHGRPKPTVSWHRDNNLVSSPRHIMTHDGSHRHTLTITEIKETDFGDYSCVAKNTQGEVTEGLYLTGLPRSPVIVSSPNGGESNSYTLRWKTETITPIRVYRIRFREYNESNQDKRHWHDGIHSLADKKPVRDKRHKHNVKMDHTFNDLLPTVDYEVIVLVENKFGWSEESEVFRFNTKKEVRISQLAAGGENIVISSLTGVVTLLIVLL